MQTVWLHQGRAKSRLIPAVLRNGRQVDTSTTHKQHTVTQVSASVTTDLCGYVCMDVCNGHVCATACRGGVEARSQPQLLWSSCCPPWFHWPEAHQVGQTCSPERPRHLPISASTPALRLLVCFAGPGFVLFYLGSRDKTQVLTLAQQAFYHLSYLSCPGLANLMFFFLQANKLCHLICCNPFYLLIFLNILFLQKIQK